MPQCYSDQVNEGWPSRNPENVKQLWFPLFNGPAAAAMTARGTDFFIKI
jgi:hypothetical protein